MQADAFHDISFTGGDDATQDKDIRKWPVMHLHQIFLLKRGPNWLSPAVRRGDGFFNIKQQEAVEAAITGYRFAAYLLMSSSYMQ